MGVMIPNKVARFLWPTVYIRFYTDINRLRSQHNHTTECSCLQADSHSLGCRDGRWENILGSVSTHWSIWLCSIHIHGSKN